MRLGRVPSWAKDPSIGYKTINVRSETVATTPSAENRSNRSDASLIHSFSQNPIDMLELRCQQSNSQVHSLDETGSTTITDTTAERLSRSLRKAGKRRHAICKPRAWPREVHSLPAPSCITRSEEAAVVGGVDDAWFASMSGKMAHRRALRRGQAA